MSRMMIMVGLVFALVAGASAELTLNIDTGAKTFSFTGTDSGEALYIGFYILDWYDEIAVSTSAKSINIPGTAFEEAIESGTFSVLFNAGDGTGGLDLYLDNGGDVDITTLTGTGVAISYSSLDADLQGVLERSIGSKIPFMAGYDYSDINVVPEPATLGLLAAGGIALLRRRKK